VSRAARYGVYALAGLVVLVLAAAFVVPRLLDRPRMAAQIQAKLSSAVQGDVRWKEFRLRLLPAPHGVLRDLEVKTAAATLTTDEVTVALRLWPLFSGSAEITSLRVAHPVLRLTVVPAAAVPEEAQLAPAQDPLQIYRSVMSTVVGALREFAPDTVVEIDNADINVRVEDLPPIEVSNLALHARTGDQGVELDATAASRYWTTMKLAGRIQYADLSSVAELHLVRIQGQAWLDWLLKPLGVAVSLPNVDLTVGFRGDPAKALELDLDGTAPTLTLTRDAQRLVASPIVLKAGLVVDASGAALDAAKLGVGATSVGGKLSYARKGKALAGDVGYLLDLPQALGYARQLAPEALARIESLSGALQGRVKLALRGDDLRVGVSVDKSDAALQVKDLPGPIRLTRIAGVELDRRSVRAERAAVTLPIGKVLVSKARYALKDGAAAANAEFDLDLVQTLALVRGVLPEANRAALDIVESASGRLRGSANGELSGKGWSAGLEVANSDAQAKLKPLPAPLALTGVTLRATPKAVTIERAAVKLLDASATAAATISEFSAPRVQASVREATIGPKMMAWVWQTAQLPASAEPKAPIRLTVPQLTWGPKSALDMHAQARFDSGPTASVELAWSPEALDVRRATIKDKASDVTVAVRSRGGVVEGSYAGTLDSRTIASMLKSAAAPAGAMSGSLRFLVDRGDRSRSTVEGELKGEGVDLSWLAGAPASLERLDVSADGGVLRIGEVSVNWAGQRATLRGEVQRRANGPVVNATVESAGIVVDALLPKQAAAKPPAKEEKAAASIWPLPLAGKVAVRTKFVQYANYKVQPLRADVFLEEERATLDVQEAFLCGLAVPVTLAASPKGLSVRAQVAAQKQKVEDAARCLTGEKVALTGTLDLRVDVRTEGKPADLLRNLKGTISADVRDGKVMKFALLGNILSMKNVVAMLGQGGPKLTADGFPFRRLSAAGRFDKGRFLLDEGLFRSNAVGLGASGWISLSDYQSRLTVLVAPLALLNEAVGMVPILGHVVGGALTSLPVAVSGDIRNPLVVPLGPGAITSELKGIFDRTLSLPGSLAPGEAKP
jgi:uncharacterized protein involved in outer membrane biogenesis